MSFFAYELWAASACITQTYLISPETHGPWQPTHKKEETTHTGNTHTKKYISTKVHNSDKNFSTIQNYISFANYV